MQFFDLFTIILFIVLIGLFALQLDALNVEKSCVPINFFAPFLIKLMSNFFLICHSLSLFTIEGDSLFRIIYKYILSLAEYLA